MKYTLFILTFLFSISVMAQTYIKGNNLFVYPSGQVAIGTQSPQAALDVTATGTLSSIILPRDTTANRPVIAVNGMIRYNTNTAGFEGYANGAWGSVGNTGTITSILKRIGLVSGTITSTGTIDVDVGTSANKIVQLTTGAQIPAVDGFLVTNLNVAGSNGFKNGGNSFGVDGVVGTLDATNMSVVAGNVTGLRIDSSGAVNIGANVLNVGSGSSGQVTLNTLGSPGLETNSAIQIDNANLSIVNGGIYFATAGTSQIENAGGTGAATQIIGGNASNSSLTLQSSASAGGTDYINLMVNNGSEAARFTSNGNIGIGTTSPRSILEVTGTGTFSSIIIPRGTTANRSATAVNGMIRYNTNTNAFEGYANSAWASFSSISTPVSVANGGTGLATLTNHAVQVGAATSNVTQVGPNASTVFPLVSGGSSADPSYALLTVPGGGTGLATLTSHAIQIGAGTSTPTQLGLGTTTTLLHGAAAGDPTWSAVSLTADVTGLLPAVNGGENQSQTLSNCSIATSVGSSALTIALKDAAGSDPSATSPCIAAFRNATIATGTYALVSSTAATSLVIRSTDTLGCINATDCYLYVYLINNAGTIELAAISGSMLDEGNVFTTVAELAAGTESVLYSTTARTGVAVRAVARLQIQESTAGTWASNSTTIANWPFKKLKWVVDATIGTCNPSLGTTSQAWQAIVDATCVMANRTGLNRIPGWIPCSTTNPPTGLTCGAGSETIGVSWLLPEPSNVQVCVTGNVQILTAAAGSTDLEDYFKLVETPNNAQTETQVSPGWGIRKTQQIADTVVQGGSACAIFYFSTSGRKTVRVFFESFIAGTPTTNQWLNNEANAHFLVTPVD